MSCLLPLKPKRGPSENKRTHVSIQCIHRIGSLTYLRKQACLPGKSYGGWTGIDTLCLWPRCGSGTTCPKPSTDDQHPATPKSSKNSLSDGPTVDLCVGVCVATLSTSALSGKRPSPTWSFLGIGYQPSIGWFPFAFPLQIMQRASQLSNNNK